MAGAGGAGQRGLRGPLVGAHQLPLRELAGAPARAAAAPRRRELRRALRLAGRGLAQPSARSSTRRRAGQSTAVIFLNTPRGERAALRGAGGAPARPAAPDLPRPAHPGLEPPGPAGRAAHLGPRLGLARVAHHPSRRGGLPPQLQAGLPPGGAPHRPRRLRGRAARGGRRAGGPQGPRHHPPPPGPRAPRRGRAAAPDPHPRRGEGDARPAPPRGAGARGQAEGALGRRRSGGRRSATSTRSPAATPPSSSTSSGRIFRWIFQTMYDRVEIDEKGLAEVRRLAADKPLVLTPSHKSHVDYMLLSWAFYEHGLIPPQVAAGINLAFWPFGSLARRAGAFFIRRTLQGRQDLQRDAARLREVPPARALHRRSSSRRAGGPAPASCSSPRPASSPWRWTPGATAPWTTCSSSPSPWTTSGSSRAPPTPRSWPAARRRRRPSAPCSRRPGRSCGATAASTSSSGRRSR